MKHVSDLWGKSTRKSRQTSLCWFNNIVFILSSGGSSAVAGQRLSLMLNSTGFVPLLVTNQTYLGPPAASQCISWSLSAQKALATMTLWQHTSSQGGVKGLYPCNSSPMSLRKLCCQISTKLLIWKLPLAVSRVRSFTELQVWFQDLAIITLQEVSRLSRVVWGHEPVQETCELNHGYAWRHSAGVLPLWGYSL